MTIYYFSYLLLFLSVLFSQWLAWRFRMPAIVIMSIAGLIIGPFTGLVSPKETFGPIFHTIISLAVAVILFEGSLSLDFREYVALRSPYCVFPQ